MCYIDIFNNLFSDARVIGLQAGALYSPGVLDFEPPQMILHVMKELHHTATRSINNNLTITNSTNAMRVE